MYGYDLLDLLFWRGDVIIVLGDVETAQERESAALGQCSGSFLLTADLVNS